MSDTTETARLRRQVVRGTVATTAGNAWAAALGFITLPIMLSGLGATGFGLWVLLQTLSVFSGWLSLGDIGLTTSSTRFIAERQGAGDRDGAAAVQSTSMALFCALGAGWALLIATVGRMTLPHLFGVPDRLDAGFDTAITAWAILTVADFVTRGCQATLEGHQRVDASRGLDVVRRTLVLVGASVTAVATGELAATAVVAAIGAVVASLASVITTVGTVDAPWKAPDRASGRLLMSYAPTVAVLRPLGVIHRTMDRLIVGVALGPEAVVVVEIATQIQNGAEAVLSASSYAVTPGAAFLRARDDTSRLSQLFLRGSRYSVLLTMPFIITPAVLAEPLVTVWVGPDQTAAVVPIVLALAYTAATAPLQVGSNLLVGVGEAREVLRAAALALALNLALSVALVGPMGVNGVFLATVLSGVVVVPLLGRSVLQRTATALSAFNDTVMTPALRSAAAMAVAIGLVLALGPPPLVTLVVGGALGVTAYVGAAMASGVSAEEISGLGRDLRPTPVAS